MKKCEELSDTTKFSEVQYQDFKDIPDNILFESAFAEMKVNKTSGDELIINVIKIGK